MVSMVSVVQDFVHPFLFGSRARGTLVTVQATLCQQSIPGFHSICRAAMTASKNTHPKSTTHGTLFLSQPHNSYMSFLPVSPLMVSESKTPSETSFSPTPKPWLESIIVSFPASRPSHPFRKGSRNLLEGFLAHFWRGKRAARCFLKFKSPKGNTKQGTSLRAHPRIATGAK